MQSSFFEVVMSKMRCTELLAVEINLDIFNCNAINGKALGVRKMCFTEG